MIQEIKDKAEFLKEIVNGSQGYVIYIRENGDVGLLNASEKINNLLGVKEARFICDIKETAQIKTDEPEKLDPEEDKPEQKGKRKKNRSGFNKSGGRALQLRSAAKRYSGYYRYLVRIRL